MAVALTVALLVSGFALSSTGSASYKAPNAKVTGKTIGYLDVFASAPIEKRFYNAFKQAATHIGWTVQLQDAAGVAGTALTAAQSLINSGVAAIVTSSLPSEWIRPIAAMAKAKGIPIINLITKATPGVYNGDIDENEIPISTALAKRIIKDHPNGAKVGVLYEGVIAAEVARLAQLKKTFAGSKVQIVATHDQPQTDAPGSQKTAIDMLNANPGINVFITASDIEAPYVLAGLRAAGNKKVTVYSYYADSASSALLKTNSQYAAVVDSDIAKVGLIAISQLLKYFTGGTITPQQYVAEKPVIVTRAGVTAGELNEAGPVPFAKYSAPFFAQWKSTYGLGS